MGERAVWIDETGPHSPLLLPPRTFWLNEVAIEYGAPNQDYYFRFFQIDSGPWLYICAFDTYMQANQCPPMPFNPEHYDGLRAWITAALNLPIECWMPRNLLVPMRDGLGSLRLNFQCCSHPKTWHCVFGWRYPPSEPLAG